MGGDGVYLAVYVARGGRRHDIADRPGRRAEFYCSAPLQTR
jgi:hypothetical protein